MPVPPSSLMIHPVSIHRTYTDYVLNFITGTAEFTVGKTLTGFVSSATGIISSIVVTSGTWIGGDAAGYIVLYNVSGIYSSTETITDNGTIPGSALASGTQDEYIVLGIREETEVVTAANGRFAEDSATMTDTISGTTIPSVTMLLLPKNTDIQGNDLIVSANIGYEETYIVQKVRAVYGPIGLFFLIAELQSEVTV
jgi:hypothetical protein